MACSVILRKSNKWDSAGDVLQQEQQQWEPRDHERKTRVYVKRKEIYWNEEIKESRKQKLRVTPICNQVKFTTKNPLCNQLLIPQLQEILIFI